MKGRGLEDLTKSTKDGSPGCRTGICRGYSEKREISMSFLKAHWRAWTRRSTRRQRKQPGSLYRHWNRKQKCRKRRLRKQGSGSRNGRWDTGNNRSSLYHLHQPHNPYLQGPKHLNGRNPFSANPCEELERWSEEERWGPDELWNRFSKHYPKMQNFDSPGTRDCPSGRRYQPSSKGKLGYGNNSFLLHGYNTDIFIFAPCGEEKHRSRYILLGFQILLKIYENPCSASFCVGKYPATRRPGFGYIYW